VEEPRGQPLRLDQTAPSANLGQPASLARPAGAPVYHGFPLVEATRTDGWCYGAVTEYEDPHGCLFGDGYVQAPDGSRAGLVWEVGEGEVTVVCAPTPDRWGVWAVWFPHPVRTVDDLTNTFRRILPTLKDLHAKHYHGKTGAGEV
jgi:hypothetical protein